jgi:hypothetical protein
MYPRDGINGFVVARGNIAEMPQKLLLAFDNDVLRRKFFKEVGRGPSGNGHIGKLCCWVQGDAVERNRSDGLSTFSLQ